MLAGNSRRIIRNTGMLYTRMLLAMIVGLYTSRVVLDVLGVDDFGTYHVVAGLVALLGFMLGAMATATQRYLAFDLGENGGRNLGILFATSLQVHALIALCIALIAETGGYWLVSTQLSIPPDRLEAVVMVYHLSVAALSISIMTVPLTAMLMAHERMGLFAVMSIADVLLKLLVVLVLPYLIYDKLSSYAALLLVVTFITFSGYLIINRLAFPAVRILWEWDRLRFRNMLGFTAWNAWGNLAAAFSEHGNNVLLNIFFGPVVNAGRSIATQANGALNQFVTNAQAAINPQIIKQYASGNYEATHVLVEKASKYNFFILLVLAMPVLTHAEQVMNIWLVTTPEHAVVFLKLTIIASLVESISRPMMASAQATGNVRLYQAVIGGLLLLSLPLSFLFLIISGNPVAVLWVNIALQVAALFARFIVLRRLTGMDVTGFIKRTLSRMALVSISAGVTSTFVFSVADGRLSIFVTLLAVFLFTFLAVLCLGFDRFERKYLSVSAVNMFRKLV